MGYTWGETIEQYKTAIKYSHITELKTNVDAERTRRGLAAFVWSVTPSQYSKETYLDMMDMRSVVDAAHGQNTCQSYNASHDASVLATHNVTYRATHDNDHRATHLSANRATHDTDHWHSHLSSNRSTHLNGYQNAVQNGYYGPYYTGVNSSNVVCACK